MLQQPFYIEPRSGSVHQSLDGIWEYQYFDEALNDFPQKFAYSTRIPLSAVWSVYESGLLPHPYENCNSKLYGFCGKKIWMYRKRFSVDASQKGKTAILAFDGISYYSRVWLNGILLGEHEGMFGGPIVNVTEQLNFDGENELVVEATPCAYGKDDWDTLSDKNSEIVPWNIAYDVQSTCGDFCIAGIWRGVRIEYLNPIHISRPYLVTDKLTDSDANLKLELEIATDYIDELKIDHGMNSSHYGYTRAYDNGLTGALKDEKVNLKVLISEKISGKTVYDRDYEIPLMDYENSKIKERYRECQFFETDIDLKNPKPWYPFDMGDPFLYTVSLILSYENAEIDRQEFDYGIRTVEMVRSAGRRYRTRWGNFQLLVNGKPIFIKGINWAPIDLMYRCEAPKYRWMLELVKNAGIHLLRVWNGGGMPEDDQFYKLCDEMGIMVWQDYFIANRFTSNYPHDVLEAQTALNLYRLRNHPSLTIHCAGNEFNPYHRDNAASMFVIDRTIRTIDPSRPYYYTTADQGSAHVYRNIEPTVFRRDYKQIPFIAESGIHSFPSLKMFKQILNKEETEKTITSLYDENIKKDFPDLINHFIEFREDRIPQMLARASQIGKVENCTLEDFCINTQLSSAEFYSVMAQSLRENFPVTTGLIPWLLNRPYPSIAVQFVDALGIPLIPYYFLKRAYASVTPILCREHMLCYPGQKLDIPVKVLNAYDSDLEGIKLEIKVYDPKLKTVFETVADASDPEISLDYTIPESFEDKFFFVYLRLIKDGKTLSSDISWIGCPGRLADKKAYEEYVKSVGNSDDPNDPHLRYQFEEGDKATISANVTEISKTEDREKFKVVIKNNSTVPAFPVSLQITETETVEMCSDNYFWLEGGEEKEIILTVYPKKYINNKELTVTSFNSNTVSIII